MVVVMALGGSTNAVLHLIAMARAAEVELTIDDFQKVSSRVPYLADLKPSGRYVQEDLHNAGGTPGVMKYLLEKGLMDGGCLTVTGKTLGENLEALPGLKAGQKVVMTIENPIKKTGHIQILRGNLSPDGAVAKITGKEGQRFEGPAKVFDSEEDMLHALEQKKIAKGDVVVIRFEGPKGGPGHAGDAHAHLGDRRRGSGERRGTVDRRTVFRRLARFHRRAHHAGGARRGPFGAGARWRQDRD